MNKKNVAIFARVSTDKQAVEMQLVELRDYLKKRIGAFIKNTLTRGIVAAIQKGRHSVK
jgi:DNA invertase Pin-like site-specific DNA recombinase